MSRKSLARKLIEDHVVEGEPRTGAEIALRIDQTLTQDATGTVVMLELEAMGLQRAKTELSVQYVDHNLIGADHRNADDHEFLRTAAARYGIWFSPPGNGVSHPLHQHHFGVPGRTLLGSDSHTPAAGALGMLALGAGGIEVALAIAGEPLHMDMPEIWGIELVGALPPWVSAKDIILELLRRHGVEGGVGRILEYHGPGLASLSAMDRHVIANMGTELGATTTVFPSDEQVRGFLTRNGRPRAYAPLRADEDALYDHHEQIDLARLQPLIAMPSSPGNVCPVAEVAGMPIMQSYVGSSANPGFRDFAIVAEIVAGQSPDPAVSLDINPATRQLYVDLTRSGHLEQLVAAGARIHQPGCNGCIGMGQAPATDAISPRTVPRNFPGRSGTREDKVCLVSPETAAASALNGEITDPRSLSGRMRHPTIRLPARPLTRRSFRAPPDADAAASIGITKGPNIVSLPEFSPLPSRLELEVLLSVNDDVSTDEIMPAGARVLPLRSNIPEISRFSFQPVDPSYAERATALREQRRVHAVVGGRNYGQGSSREHAALAPRHLGLRCVLAESFARIHRQNLIAHGILPLAIGSDDRRRLAVGDTLVVECDALQPDTPVAVTVANDPATTIEARHGLTPRQLDIIRSGGIVNRIAMRSPSRGHAARDSVAD